MKKTLYHLSGASLFVGVWRALLWLFAWPLAYLGRRHRKQERRHRELVAALRSAEAAPTVGANAVPQTPEAWAAVADQKEREAQTASPLVAKILLMQATAIRRRKL